MTQDSSTAAPSQAAARKAVAILILAGMVAYSNSFTKAFVFDDRWVTANSSLDSPLVYVRAMGVRTVPALSILVNYWLGGLEVTGYHVLNLAVHVGAALALFGIVRRTLLLERWRGRYERSAVWLALAAALLWLLHPLQTQSVTYVIQRIESIMGFFYLLTLYCVVRGATADAGRWAWYGGAVVLCLLGMRSKEVMVTAPVIVLLYDWTFLSGSWRQLARERGWLYLGLFATELALAPVILPVFFPAETTTVGLGVGSITPKEYALTQPGVILHYLRLSFWPTALCLDYHDWPVTRSWREALLPGLAIAALLLATLLGLARRSWLGFLGAWFFGILAVTSSFMPIADVAFEHRMYLPLAAVVTLVVMAGDAALRRLWEARGWPTGSRGWLEGGLLLALAVALGVLTWRRNEDYRSSRTIWADVVAKRPNAVRARANLANALYAEGDLEEAVRVAREALERAPGYPWALEVLGQVNERLGNLDRAALAYGRAAETAGGVSAAPMKHHLGVVLVKQGKAGEALDPLREAIRMAPGSGRYHLDLALALDTSGDAAEAAGQAEEALRLSPDLPEKLVEQAWRTVRMEEPLPGDLVQARYLSRLARLAARKDTVATLELRAAALAADSQLDAARQAMQEAVRLAVDAGDRREAARLERKLKSYETPRPAPGKG